VIPEDAVRLNGHINTDKLFYKTGDQAFIEVYLVDAFNKTPIALNESDQYYNSSYYLTIFDQDWLQIYNSSAQVQDSTVSFAYEISSDIANGDYYIVVSGIQTQDIVGILRIREANGSLSAESGIEAAALFSPSNSSNLVVDFYPETQKYVYEVPNRVYFKAYADENRNQTVDFKGA
jgi:hypothetical protein